MTYGAYRGPWATYGMCAGICIGMRGHEECSRARSAHGGAAGVSTVAIGTGDAVSDVPHLYTCVYIMSPVSILLCTHASRVYSLAGAGWRLCAWVGD